MDHFDIVLALSRMALSGDEKRVNHQITRLCDALKKSDPKQSKKIERLLSRDKRRQNVAPMSLQQMRAGSSSKGTIDLPGEKLSPATPLPHDKETGVPLVRIVFPKDVESSKPILEEGLQGAIEDLLQEWDRVKELAEIGVQPNMRCLLYGAPGVGKTMLARYIGKSLGLPLVEARLDSLVSSFLGTTARNIGSLFDFASRYRCILFLDEFDAIAKARDDNHEVGEIKRVVNTLLQSLDVRRLHGFTIAATNHDHLLDSAVWRRFEARIHIPNPAPEARKVMLNRFLEPVHIPDTQMQMLIWLTEGMSGADLDTLVSGGKRYLVLRGNADIKNTIKELVTKQGPQAFLDALRRQAILNAKLFENTRKKLLLGPEEVLLDALMEDADMTQSEAASVLSISQSTVSRRLKAQVKDQEKVAE